ncbi:MAG TPA: aminotransferase class III-fold pyridoxal phosphate-dependent enzyme [Candidatus Sulfotelmatobacter sp.]|nr:aminotransferase class III-fold pyridoxal phosphate-dependent enzyme [Candidatus Sulfotelmatobacter sp.]
MMERSAELGAYFLSLLQTLRSSDLKEVRGRGLWVGIELHSPARPYCEALKEQGILCKETHDRVIRIAPPLIISRHEIHWAFERNHEGHSALKVKMDLDGMSGALLRLAIRFASSSVALTTRARSHRLQRMWKRWEPDPPMACFAQLPGNTQRRDLSHGNISPPN